MKYSILFMPDSNGRLRMVVRYLGKRICFNVGYTVDLAKWSRDIQRCKRNSTHGKESVPAAVINGKIQHYEDAVVQCAAAFRTAPTTEEFRGAIENTLRSERNTDNSKDFFALYQRYINEEQIESGWSRGTVLKHQRLLKEWKMFKPKMTLEQISEDTLNAFREFQTSLGHQNETTKKKLSMSKWFFRWMVSKGILNNINFMTYRPKLKKATRPVVFLTWDELMRVYTHVFPEEKKYLARVRDVFCFCCFSSLRYSDAYALKKAAVYDDALHVITQKTNTSLTIELNKYTRAILSRYEDLPGEKALPVISNQKMNTYLKEVCFECGIDEVLTDTYYIGTKKVEETHEKWEMVGTHCGRRTFICNALMMGIAPNVVMKWTGHSDYKAMKPYIDIADEAKKNAMKLFDK